LDFEISEPKLFVAYGWKKFDLALSAYEQVNTIIPSKTCWLKFKATDGWYRPKTITGTNKALDNSGIVGIT